MCYNEYFKVSGRSDNGRDHVIRKLFTISQLLAKTTKNNQK